MLTVLGGLADSESDAQRQAQAKAANRAKASLEGGAQA
jgi:hypothetical protein